MLSFFIIYILYFYIYIMKKFTLIQEEAGERVHGGGNPFSNGHRSRDKGNGFLKNHFMLDLDEIIYDDSNNIIAIVEKKGPFGLYFECGDVKVPFTPGDTSETVKAKIEQKKSAVQHSLGSFEFRQGPYGVYMFKKTVGGKKPAFVGLPEGLDPKTLTAEAAERIYQNGLQQKKEGSSGSGRGRGGFRGRGSGRGSGSRGRGH
jgi:hypothetical protein